ncbi:MAG: DUF2330 domain-containing protein [Polyangiaceae bacterium]|nr:DUF2330 domain-containing protein [Polyangiaceae bacterium]
MKTVLRVVSVLVAVALSLALGPPPAIACAPAPREGQVVRIANEEALISWDSKKKVETFVRRASFRSSGDAFGFLVPTPSKPDLGEVDSRIFVELAQQLVPKVIYEEGGTSFGVGCSAMMFLGRASKSASAPAAVEAAAAPVRVLDEKRVAGFDAVVLSADDPAALSAWLKEKGFAEGPSLTEWLTPYVTAKWILTAFKVADPGSGPEGAEVARSFGTSAVAMTFATDRPFYPYREPRDQRETLQASQQKLAVDNRLLRVYFASDEKYEGALGDGTPFPGATKLADFAEVPKAAQKLLGEKTFLTVFDDTSNPRPGTDDVFFSVAKNPVTVTIPPTVVRRSNEITIPLDLVVLFGGMVAGVIFFIRRARRRGRA